MRVRRLLDLARRPSIEPQVLAADCGYVCLSGLLKALGRPLDVAEVKAAIGETSRGLTLKQMRDGLRQLGLTAEAIRFERRRVEAYPTPSILLLSRGHYVLLHRRRGASFEVFDPQAGWAWIPQTRLTRNTDGFAITAALADGRKRLTQPRDHSDWNVTRRVLRHYLTALGYAGVGLAVTGQLVALGLPLLSKYSIDAIAGGNLEAGPFAAAAGFMLMSALTAGIALLGNLIWSQIGRRVARSFSKSVFEHFAGHAPDWYEKHRPANVQSKLSAIEGHNSFALDALRAASTASVSLVVGVIAVFYVSPWLMIPGLLSLLLSIAVDLALNRAESERSGARLESAQRRQAFTLETLAFLPMLARYGALKEGRHRFAVLSARAADAEAKLGALRSWKTLLAGAVRAAETLLFVSLAALFMSKGQYSLGLFVAVGAYKDLLAQSISGLFQLRQRHRLLATQRHFTRDFLAWAEAPLARPRPIARAEVSLRDVAFRYGDLDSPVLNGFNLEIRQGDCAVIRGPSGCGKSTVARLICGLTRPGAGEVLVDGVPPVPGAEGFASVLQNDRLLTGTIRDNVTMLRRGVTDAEIHAALQAAACLDFVLSLPMRLETIVSDTQSGLSGGQRQRLLLARAALKRPALVLLDEATSSLDVQTEGVVLGNFRAMGATLIIIAHRPEVWAQADVVFDMDAGDIVGRMRVSKSDAVVSIT